jgi:carbon monoxide dehydrogenase subunit G
MVELTNDFRVGVPVEQAWEVLTDVERIAPCLPGAQLQEIEGDEYRGVVKVKVGPITAQYKGTASFIERDDVAHKAVLKASGRETRGQGNASATITATLVPDGDGTAVTIVTDLTITGKVAQFGRGVMADVSSALLGQFVEQLETEVLGDAAPTEDAPAPTPAPAPAAEAPEATELSADVAAAPVAPAVTDVGGNGAEPVSGSSPAAETGVRTISHRETEPVDLLQTAGSPVAKRLVPVIAGLGIIGILLLLLRRRRAQ